MLDYGLSTQQLLCLCALSSGATMTAAAEQAGVHRNTIGNWRRNLLPFQHALADAQYDRAMFFREKIEELVDLAVKTIQEILADPKAPAGIRLKAALAIIDTASTPPPPKKQLTLDIEKIHIVKNASVPATHNDAQSATSTAAAPPPPDSQPAHKDAQPAPPTTGVPPCPVPADSQSPTSQPVHNDAQTHRPNPKIANPKIGRNDACPCGSGRKYKRCCIDQSLTATA